MQTFRGTEILSSVPQLQIRVCNLCVCSHHYICSLSFTIV